MIATNAGQAVVAAGRFARRARDHRTVKPCGPDSPTLESSLSRGDFVVRQAMVAKKPGTPGRVRSKP